MSWMLRIKQHKVCKWFVLESEPCGSPGPGLQGAHQLIHFLFLKPHSELDPDPSSFPQTSNTEASKHKPRISGSLGRGVGSKGGRVSRCSGPGSGLKKSSFSFLVFNWEHMFLSSYPAFCKEQNQRLKTERRESKGSDVRLKLRSV